jgi:hypothetical protein
LDPVDLVLQPKVDPRLGVASLLRGARSGPLGCGRAAPGATHGQIGSMIIQVADVWKTLRSRRSRDLCEMIAMGPFGRLEIFKTLPNQPLGVMANKAAVTPFTKTHLSGSC